jgi:putative ABC transport system permease protein
LKDGPRAERPFESGLAAFARSLPNADSVPFNVVGSRADADAAHQSATAVVAGLVIFMFVAGLAGLVTLLQAVRRNFAQWDDERAVLGALGARRSERALAEVVGALPYLALAPFVAVAIAYASSPFFPLGATRALEPDVGLRADPLVLVVGGVACFVVLAAMTLLVAWIGAARRPARGPVVASARWAFLPAAPSGLPTAVGARFGLQPGSGSRALRRTALAGVVVAVVGVVASVVFVRSLDAFTHAPARYGLDFDLSLELPPQQAPTVLTDIARDHDLEGVAESRESFVDAAGRSVDAYAIAPVKGTIAPTVHSGRLPANDREVAVGPKLLDDLHRRVGDQLRIDSRTGVRTMSIVGTVYSPVSESSGFNEEIVLTPTAFDALTTNPTVNALVRVRHGVDPAKVMAELDARYPYAVSDESPAHAPGAVRNLQQIARLPLALVLFFAIFGAAALAQSVYLTARERRRDLAVLRGLGFRRRQVVTVLVGAGVSVAAVALVIGVPLGILAGRLGWNAVARSLYVAPAVAIPGAAIAAAALGVLVVAFLAALPPAGLVLRRSPGSTLRTE